MLLFTGLGEGYSSYFRGFGNLLFSSHWDNVKISFVQKNSQQTTLAQGHRTTNITVRINNHAYHYTNGLPVLGELGVNSHLQGYLPTALLLALFIATPINWKRRLKALGIGIFILHLFIAALLWVVIVGYTETNGIGIYRFGDTAKGIITWIMQITLVNQIGISFMMPLLLWMGIIGIMDGFRSLLPPKN
ncbi:MAG: hypothetical protein HYZ54_13120 [Ignavibacteriae bacterium]|nr:hypothetical protein [Ignavibacteriota bacterium]